MAEIVKAQGHRFKITNEGGGYRKIYVEDAAEPGGWLFLRSVRPDQDASRMIESGAESGPVHKWAYRFSRPGAPDTFAVEDRFYFGKGRKERFADDTYLDPANARYIAHHLDKIVGSMKPMGESRMDAAIFQAIGQLTKIRATLLAPKFVSISTLKTMRSQIEGLSKQFEGLYFKYSEALTMARDQKRLVDREHQRSDLPRDSKAFILSNRRYKEMADLQKDIEKLTALFKEAWRIKHALESSAKTMH